ncbi:hypothetical protein CHELA1G11_12150 [Hyphomicrobiales bacterium]|nr:hypothetical protein CHELA1G11_12150 [Hyphomicrobiales bacterium]CAH1662962.1 hypothetical protein CHELA1G2_12163 [Hyphomicrobiales bacterium]
MADFLSAVGGALLTAWAQTPLGAGVTSLLQPSPHTTESVTETLPQKTENPIPPDLPSGSIIDCDGKLKPGIVSDGSHKNLPLPASCPPKSSGENPKTPLEEGNGGKGNTGTGTQKPTDPDDGDDKGKEQKPENSSEKPSVNANGMTKGDNSLSGPSQVDVAQMALAAQRFSRALITQHQLLGHSARASTGDGGLGAADGKLWMSPIVGLGRIAQSGGGKLRYDSKGVFVGVDRSYGNLLVGGMLGQLTTSGRSVDGDTDHSAFHAALYGRADLGSFVLRGDIGASFNSYGLSRRHFAGDPLRGTQRFNANGYGLSASAFAGYTMQVSGIRVVPEIGLEFDRISLSGARGAVAEARPDLAGTTTINNLRGLVGGRMEMPLALKGTDGLSVKLTAYWARDLIDDRSRTGVTVPAVLNQMAFGQTSRSRKRSPDAAILGAEIEGSLWKDATIVASYVTELRGADTSHAVMAGLRLKW